MCFPCSFLNHDSKKEGHVYVWSPNTDMLAHFYHWAQEPRMPVGFCRGWSILTDNNGSKHVGQASREVQLMQLNFFK